jgi:hypothetical protein
VGSCGVWKKDRPERHEAECKYLVSQLSHGKTDAVMKSAKAKLSSGKACAIAVRTAY